MANNYDVVRPFQTPQNSPAQLYLSQFGLASHPPVIITPGQGGGSISGIPLQTSQSHWHGEITYYCEAAAVEQAKSSEGA